MSGAAMPVIRISDPVYDFIKGHAEPFEDTPDSVLRRLFNIMEDPAAVSSEPRGGLLTLIEQGLIKPGDRLVWHRKRLSQTYYATVLAQGAIRLDDGRIVETVSGACKALTSKHHDGWEAWRLPDGTLIDDLRKKLKA